MRKIKSEKEMTIADLWDLAMKTAAEATAESAERFQLPYMSAFALLKYIEKFAWNYVMECQKSKGWMTRMYQAVVVEADRIAYKLARYLRTADEKERSQLVAELDETLR